MSTTNSATDAAPLTPQKEQEWVAMQQSLAYRVCVPETECALRRPLTPNDTSPPMVLPMSASFIHKDFLLPWSGLEQLLSTSDLITTEAASLSAAAATADVPDEVFGGWRATTSHGMDARCWTTQLLHDVRVQTDALTLAASTFSPPPPPPPLEFIGGIDISFVPNTNIGVACLAVLRYPSLELCHRYMHHCVLTEPYLSGFLAFREVEPVMALMNKVRSELEAAQHMPQLLFIDGCGVHHPRRCGLASHLGVLLGLPTIGCAKKMLVVGDLSREWVETHLSVATGASTVAPAPAWKKKSAVAAAEAVVPPLLPLIEGGPAFLGASSPCLYGYALQTSPSVKKAVFVSPGTRVGYAMAAALVLLVSRHRVAEPIRAADLGSREYIRETFGSATAVPGP